jgi:hypothetical protein
MSLKISFFEMTNPMLANADELNSIRAGLSRSRMKFLPAGSIRTQHQGNSIN